MPPDPPVNQANTPRSETTGNRAGMTREVASRIASEATFFIENLYRVTREAYPHDTIDQIFTPGAVESLKNSIHEDFPGIPMVAIAQAISNYVHELKQPHPNNRMVALGVVPRANSIAAETIRAGLGYPASPPQSTTVSGTAPASPTFDSGSEPISSLDQLKTQLPKRLQAFFTAHPNGSFDDFYRDRATILGPIFAASEPEGRQENMKSALEAAFNAYHGAREPAVNKGAEAVIALARYHHYLTDRFSPHPAAQPVTPPPHAPNGMTRTPTVFQPQSLSLHVGTSTPHAFPSGQALESLRGLLSGPNAGLTQGDMISFNAADGRLLEFVVRKVNDRWMFNPSRDNPFNSSDRTKYAANPSREGNYDVQSDLETFAGFLDRNHVSQVNIHANPQEERRHLVDDLYHAVALNGPNKAFVFKDSFGREWRFGQYDGTTFKFVGGTMGDPSHGRGMTVEALADLAIRHRTNGFDVQNVQAVRVTNSAHQYAGYYSPGQTFGQRVAWLNNDPTVFDYRFNGRGVITASQNTAPAGTWNTDPENPVRSPLVGAGLTLGT